MQVQVEAHLQEIEILPFFGFIFWHGNKSIFSDYKKTLHFGCGEDEAKEHNCGW